MTKSVSERIFLQGYRPLVLRKFYYKLNDRSGCFLLDTFNKLSYNLLEAKKNMRGVNSVVLYIVYLCAQGVSLYFFRQSKRAFRKNISQEALINSGIFIVLSFQLIAMILLHVDYSKYDAESLSILFSSIIHWSVIISAIIVSVGVIILFFKSRDGYFLCPFGLNVLFFSISMENAAGEWQERTALLNATYKFFTFYLFIALLMFTISVLNCNKNTKGVILYEKK